MSRPGSPTKMRGGTMSPAQGTNIKVLVRVRPLLARETKEDQVKSLVSMPAEDPKSTILTVPTNSFYHSQRNKAISSAQKKTSEEQKYYSFDESVWSFDSNHSNYTDNRKFYNKTGPDIIEHFFQGFNVCLLAYGQTSSGKTYTMMGDREEPGIIPLTIRDILNQKQRLVNEKINCQLKLLYIEIYNEQVKDLLTNNQQDSKKCRVREHPTLGPYVENVTECNIDLYADFINCLNKGNANRATASTSMNDNSSRSHAIITVNLKQTKFVSQNDNNTIGEAEEEMVSNIKLVDLAGSERLSKTKLFGQQDRVKEGTLINKSLTVLGRCFNLLATNPSPSSCQSSSVIPYRDSTLTYILKENLAGNSKSFMIFCISPIDFEETHQTLNYANQVKKIKTAAKANKTKLSLAPIDWEELRAMDQSAIQSLKDEIKDLTNKLNNFELNSSPTSVPTEDNKSLKLISYLDNETSKLKFENTFLKQKLLERDHQLHELQSHVDYMDQELFGFIKRATQDKLSLQTASRLAEISNFSSLLEQHQRDLELQLEDYDPAKAF